MPYVKKAKRVARRIARGVYKGAKRRYVTKGGANIKNILSDVKMLKHLINVEKKRSDITITSPVYSSQFTTGGVSGAYAAIITPTVAEGITQGSRIGLSLKLVSGCMDIQFRQQASQINNLKLKYFIVCRPDNSTSATAATSIAQFFEPNPFTTVVDFYSSRDPEYFTAFRVIKQGTVNLKQDQITSGASIQQFKIPLKLNHHLKYNTDGSTITTKNQFYLFVTASDGNTTLGTGAELVYNMRWYYTDN